MNTSAVNRKELYKRFQIVKERLLLYETDYNERTDKLNRKLLEIEYKVLHKKLRNKKCK